MHLSEKIASNLLQEQVIEKDDQEIIQYGIQQGISLLKNFITLFFVCTFFQTWLEGGILLLFFWPLRIFSGGYHADTKTKCYIISTIAEIVVFACFRYINMSKDIALIMVFIFSTIIIIIAPQGNSNKPIDEKEYFVFRKKVHGILIIEIVSVMISFILNWSSVLKIIVWSQCLMVILLITGRNKVKDM